MHREILYLKGASKPVYLVYIQYHQTVIRSLDIIDIGMSMLAQVTLHMTQRRTTLVCALENKMLSVRCFQNKIPIRSNRYDSAICMRYIISV